MNIGIIGAGASGLMAAYSASLNKNVNVYLLEKNEKIGKKIYITGKGRCNITNAKDIEDFMKYIVRNKNFLYSSIYTFSNEQMISLLEKNGLKTKVERGDRVFPQSDKSSDVIKTLAKLIDKENIQLRLNTEVKTIKKNTSSFIVSTNKEDFYFDKLIIATGGLSYQSTGSTGDGYKFAESLGHNIIEQKPALVPILLEDNWIKNLQGVSLINVELKAKVNGKNKFKEFGEILFTNNGISGPISLRMSSYLNRIVGKIQLSLDLKPALDEEKLDNRLKRDFLENSNKSLINAVDKLTIKALIPIIISEANLDPYKKANQITKTERQKLVHNIKNFSLSYKSLDDINRAIVTSGGVDVKEIWSSSMESKLVKNLYFTGEIIDIDALTGGYNLQMAYSTGYLAGLSASEEEI